MSGGSLSTKGLVSGGGIEAAVEAVAGPEASSLSFAPTPTPEPVTIIVPTSTNVVLMVADNINTNLRKQQTSNISLPSLYKRAYLVAYETDEIAVAKI